VKEKTEERPRGEEERERGLRERERKRRGRLKRSTRIIALLPP